ncbi:PREDICTED: uncharacterized protein LOC108563632 [Nicrophorus vespilloides]|uniref:Uncharacterized protein LOC108563632 n=1 Tax=Nicrophorus vespilloides TaxID=110193 RepID=A0ABM1MTF8_NICVS|nr:PREDICTED: uncharacterized protein LOC108563632 [Nicrophorus vespilloides]
MASNRASVHPEVNSTSQSLSSSWSSIEQKLIKKLEESYHNEINGIKKSIMNSLDPKSILINLRRLKDVRLKVDEWHSISQQMYGTIMCPKEQIPTEICEEKPEIIPVPPPRTMTYAECLKKGISKFKTPVDEAKDTNCQTIDKDAVPIKRAVNTQLTNTQVTEQRKLNPYLIITGLDLSVGSEKLFRSLVEQNSFIKAKYPDVERIKMEVKIHHFKTYKVRSRLAKNVVLEVNRRFRSLVAGSQVTIGWCRFTVKDYNGILRCYKCQHVGHISKFCTGSRACSYCSGPHSYRDCNAKAPKCCLCEENKHKCDHEPYSDKCTSYRRMINNWINKNAY